MKDYPLTLNPGQTKQLNVSGNHIHIAKADSALKIKASHDGKPTPAFDTEIKPNSGRDTENTYTRWLVTNTSALAQSVIVTIGLGTAYENEVQVVGTVPTVFDDVADVSILAATKTLILAGNAGRKEAIITADAANAAVSRIGSANAGAARGTPLAAGAVFILETSAAIYAYSASAATFQISYTEY